MKDYGRDLELAYTLHGIRRMDLIHCRQTDRNPRLLERPQRAYSIASQKPMKPLGSPPFLLRTVSRHYIYSCRSLPESFHRTIFFSFLILECLCVNKIFNVIILPIGWDRNLGSTFFFLLCIMTIISTTQILARVFLI